MTSIAERPRVAIVTLWYWPSHFGCHVDDICDELAAHGVDPVVVTVDAALLRRPYFDPVRATFVRNRPPGPWPVMRIPVEDLIERGVANPLLVLDSAAVAAALGDTLENVPLLYVFETLVGALGAVRPGPGVIYYAGDFIARARALDRMEPEATVDAFLSHLYEAVSEPSDGVRPRLRHVIAILSQTRSLSATLAEQLATPVTHVRRPFTPVAVRRAQPVDVRLRLGLPDGAHVLLYAGRLSKNATALVTVLERLDTPAHLLVVGGRRGELGPIPPQLVDRVHVLPFIPRAELFGLMKTATLLVYPGTVDGWPKVIAEAQVAGLPVMAFEAPASAAHEVVDHDVTGVLVAANELTAAARAIDRLLAAPGERARLARNAQACIDDDTSTLASSFLAAVDGAMG
jgi:glycosyltransferase involved in cell wall biosynthesis